MNAAVIEALKALEKDGRLTPNAVVEAAKDKASPLHEFFQWDNKKAAEAWRIEQARNLIARAKVVYTVEHKSITAVAYVRDPSAPSGEQGYVSITRLRSDAQAAHEAVAAEFSRAASLLARAKEIAAVLSCKDEVSRIHGEVRDMRDKLNKRPPESTVA